MLFLPKFEATFVGISGIKLISDKVSKINGRYSLKYDAAVEIQDSPCQGRIQDSSKRGGGYRKNRRPRHLEIWMPPSQNLEALPNYYP